MKILAIGNSFSQDATAYLHQIAESAGTDTKVVNLYIGGCSLERHSNNLAENKADYAYELNGSGTGKMVTIQDTLCEEAWDAVTIQQVSQLSGMRDTYEPYASVLLEAIRKYAPTAKIYFHQTWAYEIDSTHGGFANYDRSQDKMFHCIQEASEAFANENGLAIIPCGTVIQKLRSTPAFDYKNGGESLCRDGFHMSFTYGRYAAGLVWFKTLLNGDTSKASFLPDKDMDLNKIDTIKKLVNRDL